jgi:hypothetical protein
VRVAAHGLRRRHQALHGFARQPTHTATITRQCWSRDPDLGAAELPEERLLDEDGRELAPDEREPLPDERLLVADERELLPVERVPPTDRVDGDGAE